LQKKTTKNDHEQTIIKELLESKPLIERILKDAEENIDFQIRRGWAIPTKEMILNYQNIIKAAEEMLSMPLSISSPESSLTRK